MHIAFEKYHGAGNDFIMIDNRNLPFDATNHKLIKSLCDRHFGIGADGLILLEKSETSQFKMIYYNADGKPGSMCGNGGRCAVAFANKLRIINENSAVLFDAADGLHKAFIISSEYLGSAVVRLGMQDVNTIESGLDYFYLNTGSPHYVIFTHDIDKIDVKKEGSTIRYNQRFNSDGTNVNFAESANHKIKVRTYERGVEDETLACGTGVTAVAIASAFKENQRGEITKQIQAKGGLLTVSFKSDGNRFSKVFLEGPAEYVFTGIVNV